MRKWPVPAFVLIAAALLGLHYELIRNDSFIRRDDGVVVLPMEDVRTVSEYQAKRKEGLILDVQPVRDLTYYVEFSIRRATGLSLFHLDNVLIWILTVVLSWLLLVRVHGNETLALKLTALYALSPLFANSTAWVSARKHLLSNLFVVIATLALVTRKRRSAFATSLLIAAAYSLSVFSQPINILWPLWAACFLLISKDKKEVAKFLGPTAPVMLLGLYLNYAYYSNDYVVATTLDKFISWNDEGAAIRILAFGRYFLNIVAPFVIAATYFNGSPYNLIGVVLLPLGLFALFKTSDNRKQSAIWALYFFLPLIVVNTKLTNVFVLDSYALAPAFGILNMLMLSCSSSMLRSRPRLRSAGKPILCALLAAFVIYSSKITASWESMAKLWTHAHETDPTPQSILNYIDEVVLPGPDPDAALMMILDLKDRYPPSENPFLAVYEARSLAAARRMTLDQKIEFAKKHGTSGAWQNYFLSHCYAQKGQFELAFKTTAPNLLTAAGVDAYQNVYEAVASDVYHYCLNAKGVSCPKFLAQLKAYRGKLWNERLFQNQIKKPRPN